ncbi:MAG TPA: YceD family protein [Xanthomonadaceae bacterium]|nr:YceD family protein [Xanthomonadaceae bacterium]
MPDSVDVWRMVAERRVYEGAVRLASLQRLVPLLADGQGECRYELEFGRDEHGGDFVRIQADAALVLTCQRTLERFDHAVAIRQRLGLIRSEAEEAALPPGAEPVLVPADGRIRPMELLEDELILALPLVPLKPGSEDETARWGEAAEDAAGPVPSPFAVLASLKKTR